MREYEIVFINGCTWVKDDKIVPELQMQQIQQSATVSFLRWRSPKLTVQTSIPLCMAGLAVFLAECGLHVVCHLGLTWGIPSRYFVAYMIKMTLSVYLVTHPSLLQQCFVNEWSGTGLSNVHQSFMCDERAMWSQDKVRQSPLGIPTLKLVQNTSYIGGCWPNWLESLNLMYGDLHHWLI